MSAFAIEPRSGRLTLLNQQSSGGAGPCHVVVDRSGKCILVANYGSGRVACLPIDDDGRLGAATSIMRPCGVERQSAAAGRATRPLDGPRPGQPLGLRLRLGAGQDHDLPARRGPRTADSQRPTDDGRGPRGRARGISPSIPTGVLPMSSTNWPPRWMPSPTMPAQGRLARSSRFPRFLPVSQGATRPPRSRCIRRAGFSTGRTAATTVSRCLRSKSAPASSVPWATNPAGGKNAAQLRHRPERGVSAGRQSGQRQRGAVSHRRRRKVDANRLVAAHRRAGLCGDDAALGSQVRPVPHRLPVCVDNVGYAAA